MKIKKLLPLGFALILWGSLGFGAEEDTRNEESIQLDGEWLFNETLAYHDQCQLTWGEKLDLREARFAKYSVVGGLVSAGLGAIPAGLSCGLNQTTTCIIFGCLLTPIGSIGAGFGLISIVYFSYQAYTAAAEINQQREQHAAIALLLGECTQNGCGIVEAGDERRTLVQKNGINAILKEFAQGAPKHAITPEELKKRLKLAALAGYLIPKENIEDMEEIDKGTLKIGQWASCTPLELVTHLALSPEEIGIFEKEVQRNISGINEALKAYGQKVSQERTRIITEEKERSERIQKQLALVEAN